jgi:hypothetical protein
MKINNLKAEITDEKFSSQLDKQRKKNIIRVAIIGKKAYWVHNNIFYESEIVDGYIDNEGAKPVDAHSLSEKEFDKLLSVLDNIV